MKKILSILIVVATIFNACDKEDDYIDTKKEQETARKDSINRNKKVNECIYNLMSDYYLWNHNLPTYIKGDDRYPEDFFESLLYREFDKWSFISENSEELSAEMNGVPFSMGYSPRFYYWNDNKNVLALVEYVYPNSPAEKSGLKRGDLILAIDGIPLNDENYYDLYCKEESDLDLGIYNPIDSTLDLSNIKIHCKAETVNADPSVYDTIFYVNGQPIGYYVYTQFTSGPKNVYEKTMDDIFCRFVNAGVENLILDLRYNGGGYIETAVHLASSIAPASVVKSKEILIKNVYNDILSSVYNEEEDIYVRFDDKVPYNANIHNVYILTTQNTASASELVSIGLMPYMNVMLIGENTYGKYTGMFILDKSLGGDCKSLGNWAIAPITMKYANANGLTDFYDGLVPNLYVEDELLNYHQFGDIEDPAVAAAIDMIGGLPLTAKSAKRGYPFTRVSRKHSISNNLFINNSFSNKKE